jgi:hypothetical protein
MADEKRRNFWTTVPGVISGVAAIVTGLGVLIPLLLGAASKHPNKNNASQGPSPSISSTTGSESPTSTAGGATGTASPLPTDSSSPLPTSSSSDSSSSSGGALGLTANPSSVTFRNTSDITVSINNPGSAPVTIEKVVITGSNANAFSIASTTCGDGSNVDPKTSCQVTLHFTPPALGSASAALEIHYHPPQSSFTTIQLKGGGGLFG